MAPDASFYIAIEGGYFKFNDNYYIGTVATGGSALSVFIGAGVGMFISGVISAGVQYAKTGTVDIGQLFLDMAVGMVLGGFGGSAIGIVGMVAVGGMTGFASSVASDWIDNKKIDWGKAAVMGIIGAATALIGGSGAQKGLTGTVKSIKGTINNLSTRSGKGIAGLTKIFKNRLASAYRNLNKTAITSIIRSALHSFEFQTYKELLLKQAF